MQSQQSYQPINWTERINLMKSNKASMEYICKDLSEEEILFKRKQKEELCCKAFNDGIGDLNKLDDYNCDKCKNKGNIMYVQQSNDTFYSVCKPCECQTKRAVLRKLKKSGLFKKVNSCSFDKYETKEKWQKTLKETAIRFTKDSNNVWFYIGGQSGCGKTHLCTAICSYYIDQNKYVTYMQWKDDSTELKSNINTEKYTKMIQSLKTVDVLYIDDLFKTVKDQNGNVLRPSGADVLLAFEILNNRYNNDLITIISSERTIDESIGGRIFEMCSPNGYLISMSKDVKKNYRLKKVITY